MDMDKILIILAVALVVFFVVAGILLRRVVTPNEVHIVQSRKKTTSYGKDTTNGNTYYEWPSWIPFVGISKTVLPVSVFDISLKDYEAYDQGRVPFVIDVIGFFRISDTNLAAQRVQSFKELENQLLAITQGAVRTVLASHDIDSIMVDRSKFGTQFTAEVEEQLKNWGVSTVKNLELMDIRDVNGGKSIWNIMEKKKSLIEAQSRIEVANNHKDAQIAEITAQQASKIQEQATLEIIGLRSAEKDQKVGIANQQAQQAVQEQNRLTKEKEMAVVRVAQTQQAQIDKDVNITKAEQSKQVAILNAEGQLESQKRTAEGIKVQGDAEGAAEQAKLMAPVNSQIALAEKIDKSEVYQKYLVTIRQIEADQAVGIEQAKALEHADIKIIANAGNPVNGMESVRDLLSSKGGLAIGSMLEGLANTDKGKQVLDVVTGGKKA